MPNISLARVEIEPHASLFGALELQITVKTDEWLRVMTDSHVVVNARTPGNAANNVELGIARLSVQTQAAELPRNGEIDLSYRLQFAPGVLPRLEEVRAGKTLEFQFWLTLTGGNRDRVPQDHPTFRLNAYRIEQIDRARWIETFLEAWHYGDYQLWEVRFPAERIASALEKEANLLKQAISDYHAGRYADAYQDCRKLHESLWARRDELGIGPDVMSKEHFDRAFAYLSTALHDRTGSNVNRSDAEFAIALARAIHRRVTAAIVGPTRV